MPGPPHTPHAAGRGEGTGLQPAAGGAGTGAEESGRQGQESLFRDGGGRAAQPAAPPAASEGECRDTVACAWASLPTPPCLLWPFATCAMGSFAAGPEAARVPLPRPPCSRLARRSAAWCGSARRAARLRPSTTWSPWRGSARWWLESPSAMAMCWACTQARCGGDGLGQVPWWRAAAAPLPCAARCWHGVGLPAMQSHAAMLLMLGWVVGGPPRRENLAQVFTRDRARAAET
jgi:hypothetical protein